MKHTAYIVNCIYFLLICCSCNYQQKKQEEQKKLDSIALVEQRSIEIADSIKAAIQKEQSLIAWGDAKFGMTTKDLKNTKTFKGGYFCEYFVSPSLENEKIDGYLFSNIKALLHNDTLYRVEIMTFSQNAKYIDNELTRAANILKKGFTTKYGAPEIHNPTPTILDIKPDNPTLMYSWNIGPKSINIYMEESDIDYEYRATCVIYNSKFTESIRRENQKIKEEQEKSFNDKF